ncbi:uncharacterized protein Dyak_GE27720 [Drosophila yakuba]|uniref:Uncharacterized protein n=1 Tax=Drosophila yakuba TaxID=7245 RepID=A0A0R1DTH0_DROYA|nr:uncharacterized protein Dyak_GE27720 [Drosophila yakuba]
MPCAPLSRPPLRPCQPKVCFGDSRVKGSRGGRGQEGRRGAYLANTNLLHFDAKRGIVPLLIPCFCFSLQNGLGSDPLSAKEAEGPPVQVEPVDLSLRSPRDKPPGLLAAERSLSGGGLFFRFGQGLSRSFSLGPRLSLSQSLSLSLRSLHRDRPEQRLDQVQTYQPAGVVWKSSMSFAGLFVCLAKALAEN